MNLDIGMNGSKLKTKLNAGKLCLGAWMTLGHSAIAEIFANAGFDWIVVDLEHSTISIEQAGDLIRTIDLSGVSALVRLTSNDANQIKRVLDAGAHGIVIPNIKTVDEATLAVASTRYAPKGVRGVGLGRAQKYGPGFKDYLSWQEEDGPIVIVMIEDIAALPYLEEILSTDGIDGFIIGPYDLSCSMGIPGDFERPEFKRVVQQILEMGLKVGCPSGIHIVEPDPEMLNEAIKKGYRFIAYGVDIRMLDTSARLGVSASFKDFGK